MRKLLTLSLVLMSLLASAQTGSIKDPVTGKKITYSVSGTQISYSNGKVAFPSIPSTDYKLAYLTATVPVIVVPPVVVPPSTSPVYITIGTGSGQLNLGTISGKNLKIKPGTYSYIGFDKATDVKIDATGVIMPGGSFDITNASNVEVFGMSITDQSYRAINIRGFCTGLYLHDISFKNIGNYVIAYEYQGVYDGTDATLSKDWKFEKLSFENTSTCFNAGGGYTDAGIQTLFKNFKFLNCTIKNSPDLGNIIWMAAVDGYEIAGNTADNINRHYPDPNAPHGYHNGVFHMWGNGSFHDNRITNFQGNLIRAWGVSFGTTVKTVLIYNNIAYNSDKYGAFELQFTPELQDYLVKYPNRISITNAEVYNNTAGHLNNFKDWDGQMLDLYNTGGTLKIFNNVGFEMVASDPIYHPIKDNMVNDMSDVKIIQDTNNRYFSTQAAAVADTKTFKSLTIGIGAQ